MSIRGLSSSSETVAVFGYSFPQYGQVIILRLLRGLFQRAEISFFAARHKTFGDGFQFLPARADSFRLGGRDLIVGGGGGDDGEQVGEFLHDLVRRRNQEVRMRRVLWIQNKKSARALANPLDEPVVAGALE